MGKKKDRERWFDPTEPLCGSPLRRKWNPTEATSSVLRCEENARMQKGVEVYVQLRPLQPILGFFGVIAGGALVPTEHAGKTNLCAVQQ